MRFDDQHILVTGASGSIGQAIARAFAGAGARVALHFHRKRAEAEALRTELPGSGHITIGADIADAESVRRMVDQVVAAFGSIHVLVNNAAIYLSHPVAEVDYQTWQRRWEQVIAINLIGAANVSYCVARHMMSHGGGRIVNVSSRGAYRGEPGSTSYGASKAGLNALSQSLAIELAPHKIYVTAVAPGWVEGGMAEETLSGPQAQAIKQQSPLGRIARPEEVAYTVLFLASEGAEFLTGAVVDINGASYLR
ncbi:MAG: epimerase [Herpetosiphonaceae bacterium]|nr:MAG: epimerase [Herpetosiphonaceae bacterium]